jgi:hypothetical protein
MPHTPPRFECRPEPSGTWMVWDTEKNRPSTLGGSVLNGMEKGRAATACELLTRIFRNRLEVRSVRHDAPRPL